MSADATISVYVPPPLRSCCAGAAEVDVPATTIRSLLEEIGRRYPELHRNICDETGAMRRHINLFVNSRHMRDHGGLDSALSPGDSVVILPAVSGG